MAAREHASMTARQSSATERVFASMQLREHKGSLHESMATVKRLDATRDALLSVVRAELAHFGITFPDDAMRLVHYGRDDRIGWDCYVVTVDGYGVFGFIDGPLRDSAQ